MRQPRLGRFLPLTALAGLLACSSVDVGEGDDQPPPKVVDLVADTNRDGWVNAEDNADEQLWSALRGAAFMANFDDDDFDGLRDAEDDVVNGEADAYDLARVLVQPWDDVPEGAVGWVWVDERVTPHVRIFKLDVTTNTWTLVIGSSGPCGARGDMSCPWRQAAVQLTEQEIRDGVQFGVEAKTLPGMIEATVPDPVTGVPTAWDGLVTMHISVVEDGENDGILTEDNPTDGIDRVQLRVAPWLMFGNLTSQVDTIHSNNVSGVFVQGIQVATSEQGKYYNLITNWADHWTEDYFQTGFTSVPWTDGQVHGMRLAMPRPWGRADDDSGLPVNYLRTNHLRQDGGMMQVYRDHHTGDSYDSYGNHDLVPAYTNGAQSFPYGRIIYGSGVLQETKDFYEAQRVQAPALTVDTSWLIVGHVDEVFSYVPAATERGWKLLVGSSTLARSMLTQWQAQGHGSQPMFVGKRWSDGRSAEITIDEVLADPDLMASSQQGQAHVDGMLAVIQAEVGLTAEEIIEIPFLFEEDFGALVAYNPGTVNSLVFEDNIVIPDPFGPSINGEDGFKRDLIDRLGTAVNGLGTTGQGMRVYFTDDWDMYHRLLGEVHCGTNQEGPPQPDMMWWEVVR